MSDFSEKLAKARAARPFRDVQVILDGEISAEKERLEELLESADTDQRLGAGSEAEDIQARIDEIDDGDSVLTLRFTRLPGRDWAELTSHHPTRLDVPVDRHYGYNYDAVCEEAAKMSGARIEDGQPVEMIVEKKTLENPDPKNEWAELFDVLSGADIGKIRDVVWELNQYESERRLNALVKSSGAATRSVNK